MKKRNKAKKREYSKLLCAVCVAFGMICVTMTYVLAFLGRTDIAESLSTAAMTELIGSVLAYSVKAAFENVVKIKRGNSDEVKDDSGDN